MNKFDAAFTDRNKDLAKVLDMVVVVLKDIDNVIKKCSNINIQTKVDSSRIYEIKISDNYTKGFEDLLESKQNHPFNMGYIREGHDDDNETSEFGIGMKAGAIACSNKFTQSIKIVSKKI